MQRAGYKVCQPNGLTLIITQTCISSHKSKKSNSLLALLSARPTEWVWGESKNLDLCSYLLCSSHQNGQNRQTIYSGQNDLSTLVGTNWSEQTNSLSTLVRTDKLSTHATNRKKTVHGIPPNTLLFFILFCFVFISAQYLKHYVHNTSNSNQGLQFCNSK